jgi:superfamily II DNA or RNA helicase
MGAFDDLKTQFEQSNQKRKGDDFELVCKWFLENDPTYRPLLRKVWLWKDWPGDKRPDAGIDLVAEDRDGNLWAIQAKCYGEAYSISKRHIDGFVAESSREVFKHRLLIGTTDKRHHIAKKLMDDLCIPFIGLTQLREADDYLDWPASPKALRPSKAREPKKPFDYQKSAINDVLKGFETADRGQLIMACGTGKTLTAWFITERLEAERTLVLVPSLSLLKQTMREWQIANPREPFATLPVCSDETVGSHSDDAAVSHTSDLGVPVTTDPEVIAEFLRKGSGRRVVFSTYQSSPQIADAFTLGAVPAFDLVIADEAHRVAGPVSSDFGTVLDAGVIKAKRRLFMTATPRYFTGRVLREARDTDYEIASMDDRDRFGQVFHCLSFGEAIERKLLTDYQVAIIGVDDTTYKDWADRGTLVTLDGKEVTDARSLAGQIGLAKAMKNFDLHRVITFHSRVKAAREFAASMPAVLQWMPPRQRPEGRLWSDYASGEMSTGERSQLIQHLKHLDDGERGLLANARCLAEGVDVPALDGVAFIEPRRSEVDIVQAVGRAIRKSDTKTIGTIVIPVFIDTNEDARAALDSSAFKPVWDVIKALRAHDEEFGEELDALRREVGRTGGRTRLPSKIHVDVPATVGKDFVNALEVCLVDATTASWHAHFGCLEQFVETNGHCDVPADYLSHQTSLQKWCEFQRTLYRKQCLPEARRELLETVQCWSWHLRDAKWEKGFALLTLYLGRNGHSRVSKSTSLEGYPLGKWVDVQRARYRDGVIESSRRDRLSALEGWSWNPISDRWETGYNELLAFIEVNEHAQITSGYQTLSGYPLGRWVSKQRTKYKGGTLRDDRRDKLEALQHWTWNPHEDSWGEGFRHLREFADKEHHSTASQSTVFDGYPLGTWVAKQRSDFNKGKLSADRVKLLESIKGWSWDPRTEKWEEAFARLVEYVARTKHARVQQSLRVDNYPLGRWVAAQRASFAKGNLEIDRQRRLEELPGWTWNATSDQWDDWFQLLLDYVGRCADSRVPAVGMFKGRRLGTWVSNQRINYAKGLLDADRQQRLESLPGWTWSAPQGSAGHRRQ